MLFRTIAQTRVELRGKLFRSIVFRDVGAGKAVGEMQQVMSDSIFRYDCWRRVHKLRIRSFELKQIAGTQDRHQLYCSSTINPNFSPPSYPLC